jgi:hypothetical protein
MSKAVVLALLAVGVGATGARAQVGHDPARSPFRDVVTRQHLTLLGGRFGGSRTDPGVGARPGMLAALRFESRLSGPLDLSVSFARINSTRWVVDPLVPPPRTTGPVDYTLLASDVSFNLNLTGAKSWRGLAPYVSFGIGLVSPTTTRTDNGGYKAGSNFALIPGLGARFYLARHWALRAEVRDYYFRYEWPLAYFTPTDASGNPVPNPVLPLTASDKQWTHNAALSLGLTYAFTF